MKLYRMRLAYLFEVEQTVFLTWRLHGSLSPHQGFPPDARNTGQAFAATDRLLDEAGAGPAYFREPDVADMIVETIQFHAEVLGHYHLHAFAVMPNHVHLLATPTVALPKLTKSLKDATAAWANGMLGLTEGPFWADESYHRAVRYEAEFEEVRNYIEENPVRAGMVRDAREYRWSSAAADALIPEGMLWPSMSIRSSRDGWKKSLTWQDE